MSKKRNRVALLGATPNNGEPLGLLYLSTALRRAGHEARCFTFTGPSGIERAARDLVAYDPTLAGISMPSGASAIDGLACAGFVRKLGFTGHFTCGGPFATLARRRLLGEYGLLDSIVRLDGEPVISLLADAIANGTGLDRVAGVTTRAGDGPPAPVFDSNHFNWAPDRERLGRFAGVPAAKIAASRGCHGACRYCGLAALRKTAAQESHKCAPEVIEAGRFKPSGLRRRPVESVADEMSALYHERGVRFFHFVDENHLPHREEEAVKVAKRLSRALDERGVRDRAVSMMFRSDIATPAVLSALKELGVVRSLLGVESLTSQGLADLRRGGAPMDGVEAAENMRNAGLTFHCNLLLIQPESTLETITAEIDRSEEITGGLIDPFQVEAFEGTSIFESLKSAGRLEGGPLTWHYWPTDAGARRFAEIFYRVRRAPRGFGQMTAFVYDTLSELAIARQLGRVKAGALTRIEADADHLIAEHNRVWRRVLLEIRDAAVEESTIERMREIVGMSQGEALRLLQEAVFLKRSVAREAEASVRTTIFYPAAAAAAAFALSILNGGGCHRAVPISGDGDTDSIYDYDAGGEVDSESESGSEPMDTETESASDTEECDTSDAYQEMWEIASYGEEAGCGDICPEVGDYNINFVVNEEGKVIDILRDDGVPMPEELKECYLAAVADQTYPCLAEYEGFGLYCDVIPLE